MALDILHNVIMWQPVRLDACISKGKGCAKRTHNATLCKHSFHRFAYWHKRNGGGGWSEVSFCFVFFALGQLFATAGTRNAMCCWALAKNNAKSMTVANGGNAIEDRLSVGFVRLGSGLSRIFSVRGQSVGKRVLSIQILYAVYSTLFCIWLKG